MNVTDIGRGGEFYANTSDGIQWGQSGSHVGWDWERTDGEWATQIVELDAWSGKTGVTLSNFRFDPLAQDSPAVKSGESITIGYIALFATEADARAFDIAAYRANPGTSGEETAEKYDWPTPDYQEQSVVSSDNVASSVKYSVSDDGATVTISYLLNGQTVSYTVPNDSKYLFGGYAGTDDLGRSLYNQYSSHNIDGTDYPVGVIETNGEHYVGIFYFLWLGEHGDQGILDITKIAAKHGDAALNTSTCSAWGGAGAWHFFSEPLYGYYYSSDEWVIRKHMELLTAAGVDFLYFDVTNSYPYISNAKKLMKVCHEMNEEGFDAPQVVFYTHTSPEVTVKKIYDGIYGNGLYPYTWFRVDGKPLIIAPDDANIDGFFTIRNDVWPNEKGLIATTNANKTAERYYSKIKGCWPWIDWVWPQVIFKNDAGEPEVISVSVAQHAVTCNFARAGLYGAKDHGRSYNGTWDLLDDQSYKYGYNLQCQFNTSISNSVKYTLVTGWNEWVAQRQDVGDGTISFVDTATIEYSRDIEMTRGYYFDNYYMQLVYNIQAIKGAAPVILQDGRKAVNVTGSFDQWSDVAVTYTDPTGDCADRNSASFGSQKLTDETGRNDISELKVVNDTKNLYFYVKTVDDITKYDTDSAWMRIYVNVDGETTGWYGYDYIINYSASGDFTTNIAVYSGKDGEYAFTPTQSVSYRCLNNEMMIAVPMEYLGITDINKINLQFKCADGKCEYNEMEDFYCFGDTAPLGRLNYVYQNYIQGVTEEKTPVAPGKTDETSASDTSNDKNTSASDTQTGDIPSEKGGLPEIYIYIIAAVAAVAVTGIAVYLILKKANKKK